MVTARSTPKKRGLLSSTEKFKKGREVWGRALGSVPINAVPPGARADVLPERKGAGVSLDEVEREKERSHR